MLAALSSRQTGGGAAAAEGGGAGALEPSSLVSKLTKVIRDAVTVGIRKDGHFEWANTTGVGQTDTYFTCTLNKGTKFHLSIHDSSETLLGSVHFRRDSEDGQGAYLAIIDFFQGSTVYIRYIKK